jgi:DNA-binding transcriptional MerR regulator
VTRTTYYTATSLDGFIADEPATLEWLLHQDQDMKGPLNYDDFIAGTPAGGGPRVYRRADVELVLRIKQLVFDEGLTLSGARRRLEEEGEKKNGGGPILVDEVLGDHVRDRIKNVRTGLRSILEMLSKDGERQPELRLVAPGAPAAPKKKTVAKAKAKK